MDLLLQSIIFAALHCYVLAPHPPPLTVPPSSWHVPPQCRLVPLLLLGLNVERKRLVC